jgi:hypothetical protein
MKFGFWTIKCTESWICYDFDKMTIKVIHADRERVGLIFMFSKSQQIHELWTVEGWRERIELDRRENNTELTSQGAIRTFPVSHSDEVLSEAVRPVWRRRESAGAAGGARARR